MKAMVFSVTGSLYCFSLTILFLLTSPVSAHPGKTDHYGGHKCWRNCEEWELIRGEYHLHDKDGNPIFVDRREEGVKATEPKGVPVPDKRFLMEEASGPPAGQQENPKPDMQKLRFPLEKQQTLTVYEESLLPFNYILLLLLALLMLMVLIVVRKKRDKE